jgi:hypothetical protein
MIDGPNDSGATMNNFTECNRKFQSDGESKRERSATGIPIIRVIRGKKADEIMQNVAKTKKPKGLVIIAKCTGMVLTYTLFGWAFFANATAPW